MTGDGRWLVVGLVVGLAGAKGQLGELRLIKNPTPGSYEHQYAPIFSFAQDLRHIPGPFTNDQRATAWVFLQQTSAKN